jgi:UDP-N-acetylmuramoylalanine--D-glutamate ligase
MDFQNKRVLVMGLGRFSGGVAATCFLAAQGARLVVTDAAAPETLRDSLDALAGCAIERFRLGGHDERDFREADYIVVNPAVPRAHPLLDIARSAGATLTSEMTLFFQFCRGRIVGVTGSNGKSTTSAMIHALLQADGRTAWLGGNIGRSLLDRVFDIQPSHTVVLELSSFQLQDLDPLCRSPQVAVVTTFTPNHLDRHSSLDDYRQAKQTILRFQRPGDLAILNAGDPDVCHWSTRCETLHFGIERHGRRGTWWDGGYLHFCGTTQTHGVRLDDVLALPGPHNRANAAAAACVALALGVSDSAVRRGLAGFRTLPHRLEFVAEVAGRNYYEDSIATTPESTQAALAAFPGRRIWLIAGGSDKQVDLSGVARSIAERVEGVALIGQTGPSLASLIRQSWAAGSGAARAESALSSRPDHAAATLAMCDDLPAAVRWCHWHASPGDVILLSPACASFGMFTNFVHRAEVFRQAVAELPRAAAA